MLPMLDAWTDVFAAPGKRTTGTGPQDYVLVGPGYDGNLPDGIPVIHAPTPHVWIIARPQTNGPADYAAVNAFQDGLQITTLGKRAPFEPDPTVDTSVEPLHVVDGLSAVDFFTRASAALAVKPPHSTDYSQLYRLALLGIAPGGKFDAGAFDAEAMAQIEAGVEDAQAAITRAPRTLLSPVDGWVTLPTGVYGNDYLVRAAIAKAGLGANPPEDAIYSLMPTVRRPSARPTTPSTSTRTRSHPSTPSGRSPCTAPKGSRVPTNWTASPSATATTSATALTAPWISTSPTPTPDPTTNPTGFQPLWDRSASRCASTLPISPHSTAPGRHHRYTGSGDHTCMTPAHSVAEQSPGGARQTNRSGPSLVLPGPSPEPSGERGATGREPGGAHVRPRLPGATRNDQAAPELWPV